MVSHLIEPYLVSQRHTHALSLSPRFFFSLLDVSFFFRLPPSSPSIKRARRKDLIARCWRKNTNGSDRSNFDFVCRRFSQMGIGSGAVLIPVLPASGERYES